MPPTASIHLSAIRVRDFRGIEDLWLPIQETTVLVGENNAGKSTVVDAIGIALGRRGRPADIRLRSDTEPCECYVIDAMFQPAPGEDEFPEDVSAWLTNQIQFPEDETQPPFFAIRTSGTHDRVLDRVAESKAFLSVWEPTEVPEDSQRLAGGIPARLREALLFQLLDARRDFGEQLRNRGTHWGRLVSDLGLSAELETEVLDGLKGLGERIVSGSDVLTKAKERIQTSIDALAPASSTAHLEPLPTIPDQLTRSLDVLVGPPAGPRVPLALHGMGSRSLTVLTIFQAFAERRLDRREDSTLFVSAFEEPEAHLHPQAARAVHRVLDAVPGQRIVTTHSSSLVSECALGSICIMARRGSAVTPSWLPAELTTGIEKDAQIRKMVVRRLSDILFARSVILVEGDTEEHMLPVFVEKFFDGRSASELGISIVEVNGAQNMVPFARLLAAFRIPWIALLDGDDEGLAAAKKVAAVLGEDDHAKVRSICTLPTGQDIETYVTSPSRYSDALLSVQRVHGTDVLTDYIAQMQGSKGKGGVPRDYTGPGGDERALRDLLRERKSSWGHGYASECCANGYVPGCLATVLARCGEMLGIDGAGLHVAA